MSYSELKNEQAHIEADSVLMQFLTDLGYADVAAEFDKVPKWYA